MFQIELFKMYYFAKVFLILYKCEQIALIENIYLKSKYLRITAIIGNLKLLNYAQIKIIMN